VSDICEGDLRYCLEIKPLMILNNNLSFLIFLRSHNIYDHDRRNIALYFKMDNFWKFNSRFLAVLS